jgi:hypothetical protein
LKNIEGFSQLTPLLQFPLLLGSRFFRRRFFSWSSSGFRRGNRFSYDRFAFGRTAYTVAGDITFAFRGATIALTHDAFLSDWFYK